MAGSVTELRVIGALERRQRATALENSLPPQLHPAVELDWAGMNVRLRLDRPAKQPRPDAAAEALELVRAHPVAFGVRNPDALHAAVSVGTGGTSVDIGEGEAYAGHVEVLILAHEITFRGHLWPVAVPPIVVDRARLLEPYLGRTVKVPSRRLGRDFDELTTLDGSFNIAVGPAFVCAHGVARVREAALVRLMASGNPLPDLPGLFDAATFLRVGDDFILPEVNGAEDAHTPRGESHANGCFER
jgi:hypothetical protein